MRSVHILLSCYAFEMHISAEKGKSFSLREEIAVSCSGSYHVFLLLLYPQVNVMLTDRPVYIAVTSCHFEKNINTCSVNVIC